MEKEPYKLDIKELLIKGDVGASETYKVELKKDIELDGENTLKDYIGEVKVTLLEKEVLAEFNINYTAQTVCARCLKRFKREGRLSFDREYLIGRRVAEGDELLVDKEFQIEVGEPTYEEIVFDIPMKPICKENCKGIK